MTPQVRVKERNCNWQRARARSDGFGKGQHWNSDFRAGIYVSNWWWNGVGGNAKNCVWKSLPLGRNSKSFWSGGSIGLIFTSWMLIGWFFDKSKAILSSCSHSDSGETHNGFVLKQVGFPRESWPFLNPVGLSQGFWQDEGQSERWRWWTRPAMDFHGHQCVFQCMETFAQPWWLVKMFFLSFPDPSFRNFPDPSFTNFPDPSFTNLPALRISPF